MKDLTNVDENKVRFICLLELTRTLLVNLIAYFVVNQNVKKVITSSKPDIALKDILQTRSPKELRDLYDQSNLQCVKDQLFSSNNPLVLSSSIDVTNWDVTSLICLLQNISWFHTCKEMFRKNMITCVGNPHIKCCINCQHHNGKGNCVQCCGTTSTSCYKDSTPCCSKCKMCLYCSKQNNIFCDSTRLRTSIDVIRNMRNFLQHSVPADFVNLDNGNFANDNFPLLKDFNHLWNFCSKKIMSLLTYLYNNGAIDKFRYYRVGDDIKNNILLWSKEQLYQQHRIAVDNIITVSKLTQYKYFTVEFSLSMIKKMGLWNLLCCKKKDEFSSSDRSLNSSLSCTIEQCVRDLFIHSYGPISTENYNVNLRKPRIENTSNGNDITYSCFIEAKEGNVIPKCYHDRHSLESQRLWNDLEIAISTTLFDNLHIDANVGLVDWYRGSLNITINISKDIGSTWQKNEINQLDRVMESVTGSSQISNSLKIKSLLQKPSLIQYPFEVCIMGEYILRNIDDFVSDIQSEVINKLRSRVSDHHAASNIGTKMSDIEIQELIADIQNENIEGVRDTLVLYPAAVHWAYKPETTLLIIAIKKENVPIIRLLLDAGANVEQCGGGRTTPLITAIKKENLPIIRLLLDARANVEQCGGGRYSESPLFHAIHTNDNAVLDQMVQVCDVNKKMGERCFSPLHEAVDLNNEAIVSTLVKYTGTDLNIQDKNLNTPLHIAVEKDLENIVKILIEVPSRIDLNMKNRDGMTASMVNTAGPAQACKLVKALKEMLSHRRSCGPDKIDFPPKVPSESIAQEYSPGVYHQEVSRSPATSLQFTTSDSPPVSTNDVPSPIPVEDPSRSRSTPSDSDGFNEMHKQYGPTIKDPSSVVGNYRDVGLFKGKKELLEDVNRLHLAYLGGGSPGTAVLDYLQVKGSVREFVAVVQQLTNGVARIFKDFNDEQLDENLDSLDQPTKHRISNLMLNVCGIPDSPDCAYKSGCSEEKVKEFATAVTDKLVYSPTEAL